jgi:hypothetical protein
VARDDDSYAIRNSIGRGVLASVNNIVTGVTTTVFSTAAVKWQTVVLPAFNVGMGWRLCTRPFALHDG